MIRVAVDATPLIGQRTGIGVFTAGAINALSLRAGLQLIAYAATWRGRGQLADQLPGGVQVCRVPMAARPLRVAWGRFDGPVIEWWTGPVEVVHGTNFVVPPTGRAAEVVTVHDLTCIRFPELCEPATLQFPGLIRRALRRGAMVHTHAQAVADEVVELLGANPDRVRAVAPGIDIDDRTGSNGRAPGPGRPYVLALGRVEPRKDLPSLVRAFDAIAAAHPELDLVIAGPPGWAEEALTAAFDAAHHRDRIHRLGWLGDADKDDLLWGASVFAYPSVYEGFGLPPLEAMAARVPVVATAAGGLAEAVGDAALVVPVGDTDALAAALASVLDDDDRRARLVTAGVQQVGRFTWDRGAAGLHALYLDAAGDRPLVSRR